MYEQLEIVCNSETERANRLESQVEKFKRGEISTSLANDSIQKAAIDIFNNTRQQKTIIGLD
jgi:hypothetical protein